MLSYICYASLGKYLKVKGKDIWCKVLYRGLAAYASSVSFGHAECSLFFDSLDTQKFMSEFAEDDFS